ncbi:MAG: M20/M25/M40 family metallo-hydrolase [Saprospiraceae bacterium]|nr:M20/M25/M40 family metallo-hydrolase [Saprospiraceae bacterium]
MLYSFLIFLSACSTSVKYPVKHPVQNMAVDLIVLSADEMEGRETGTVGEEKAGNYIEDRFREIGLTPKGDYNSYFQSFSKKIKSNPHADKPAPDDPEITGRNVIGFIDNKAPYTIVLGAHYDHLGYGDHGSLHTGERAIHNGADDNASGVTGLLYLAESLKKSKLKNNNYLFIAFSGEEKGLLGSNYFINNPTIDFKTINYFLNMDMIGRLKAESKLAVSGIGTSPAFEPVIDTIKYPNLSVKKEMSGSGPSDHMSFYMSGIPVLAFFTGQHEDYHKPSDDAHLINYSGIKYVSEYIYNIIHHLNKKGKLEFTKTQDPIASTRAFSVTLGVMPDYLYDGKGMRIDGVRDGRPGQVAGLQKGDIIIKIGELEVVDINSYMKCLTLFKLDQTTEIVIIREGTEITKEVTFK